MAYTASLQQLYQQTADDYRAFFQKVRSSFKEHCHQIRLEAEAELAKLDPNDKEARKAVLAKQKAQLDESLGQLKLLLNHESAQMRQRLESIRTEQEMAGFDLERELAAVA